MKPRVKDPWVSLEPWEVEELLQKGEITRIRPVYPIPYMETITNVDGSRHLHFRRFFEQIIESEDVEGDLILMEYRDSGGPYAVIKEVTHPFGELGEVRYVRERIPSTDGLLSPQRMPRERGRLWVTLESYSVEAVPLDSFSAHGLDAGSFLQCLTPYNRMNLIKVVRRHKQIYVWSSIFKLIER